MTMLPPSTTDPDALGAPDPDIWSDSDGWTDPDAVDPAATTVTPTADPDAAAVTAEAERIIAEAQQKEANRRRWFKPWSWFRKEESDTEPPAEEERNPIEGLLQMFVYTIAGCTVIGGLLGWWSYTHPLFGSIWAGLSIGFGTGAVCIGLYCLRMEYRIRGEAGQAVLAAAAAPPPAAPTPAEAPPEP